MMRVISYFGMCSMLAVFLISFNGYAEEGRGEKLKG